MTAPTPARDIERCDDCRRRVGEHHDNMCADDGTVKATPARDSRVEKLNAKWANGVTDDQIAALDDAPDEDSWEFTIYGIEAAGLVVLDPGDAATIDRVAGAIWDDLEASEFGSGRPGDWNAVSLAHSVLTALRGDR